MQGVSPQATDLMMSLLQLNPEDRPTAKIALKHPWFLEDREALNHALQINSFLIKSPLKRFSNINSNMDMRLQ